MIFFRSNASNLPELVASNIIDDWFADMKSDNDKYIIFKNQVLKYEIGNLEEKEEVLNTMRLRGIPEAQFGWSE